MRGENGGDVILLNLLHHLSLGTPISRTSAREMQQRKRGFEKLTELQSTFHRQCTTHKARAMPR